MAVAQEPGVDGDSGHGGASGRAQRGEETIGGTPGHARTRGDDGVDRQQGLSSGGSTSFNDVGLRWRFGDFEVGAR